MNSVRGSHALDRYYAGENDVVMGPLTMDLEVEDRGIIYFHGSGQFALDVTLTNRLLMNKLARDAVVHIGDLGGQSWGKALAQTQAAKDLLTDVGCTKIAAVGTSMGACNALNFIVRESDQLECAALLIPLTDLVSARANPFIANRWPEIDALYGGNYTGYNPIDFAEDIDPDFPMKIWYSSNDPLVYPSTVAAFIAARPQTEYYSMGAVLHDVPVVFNDGIKHWITKEMP